MDKFLHKILKY